MNQLTLLQQAVELTKEAVEITIVGLIWYGVVMLSVTTCQILRQLKQNNWQLPKIQSAALETTPIATRAESVPSVEYTDSIPQPDTEAKLVYKSNRTVR